MRSDASAAPERHAGFTLLEVMAAIALLGIVFTVLARSAAVGVLSEGASRRLLEASLVADSQLAELELAAMAGQLPEPGVIETEFEDFAIVIEAQPWSLPDRLQEERDSVIATPSPIFGDGTDREQGVVREIWLKVIWHDGVNERSVERVTYLVDFSAVSGIDAQGGLNLLGMEREIQDAVDDAVDGGGGGGGGGPRRRRSSTASPGLERLYENRERQGMRGGT